MRRDHIDVVEAGYTRTGESERWLAAVLDRTGPLIEDGFGSFGVVLESRGVNSVEVTSMQLRECRPEIPAFIQRFTPELSHEEFSWTWGSNVPFATLSSAAPSYDPGHWLFRAFREELGVSDFLMVRAMAPEGFGCFVAAGRRSDCGGRAPGKSRDRARWSRVAAHLVAGLRLHRRSRIDAEEASPLEGTAVEAILEERGKVVHAAGPAEPIAARESLRDAVRARARSRSAAGRRAPDEALEAWRALVTGRWSLVDVVDSDGRRFVVARENRTETAAFPQLTDREREVVAHARMGASNKLIAYTLGLAESTVSECLRRGLDKLGLRSRMELLRGALGRGTE